MPLDPSIILSGTRDAGAGIDVNALMTQQMQGMEAINQMERQRKADELVMQDREASNLARALAPAIGSVFADPSDEGLNVALGMVPEQYRGAMQAQVDQLRGIPDLNRRKDVVRAALVQDKVGQALLAQLEPSANARLQADTAAQRAALDARRLQMEENKLAMGEQMTPYQQAQIALEQQKLAAAEKARTEAPKLKLEAGQSKVDDTLSEMLLSYQKLKKEGAVVSTEASGLENVIARTGAALGTTAGRALGTKAQTERDYIQNLRMDLIRDIKQATGMSAQELNSNFELQAALDALGDPYGQSFESAIRTIVKLSKKYGAGKINLPSTSETSASEAAVEGEDPELDDLLNKYLPK